MTNIISLFETPKGICTIIVCCVISILFIAFTIFNSYAFLVSYKYKLLERKNQMICAKNKKIQQLEEANKQLHVSIMEKHECLSDIW